MVGMVTGERLIAVDGLAFEPDNSQCTYRC